MVYLGFVANKSVFGSLFRDDEEDEVKKVQPEIVRFVQFLSLSPHHSITK